MAKKGIHPVYKPSTISCACGNKVETFSTRGAFSVEICSAATRSTRASRSSSTRPAASSASRRSTARPRLRPRPYDRRRAALLDQLLLEQARRRRGALRRAVGMLADPAVLANRQQMQKLSKEHSDLRELVETFRQYRDRAARSSRRASCKRIPEMRDLARQEETELAREQERLEKHMKVLLMPKDPERREEHPPRDPRRHRRRGGGAVRRRSVPHVHALRRAPPLGGRDPVELERVGRRHQGGRGRHQRPGRLLAAQVRVGRAPRPARARHRGAGAHPHLDGDRGRHARGRGRRDRRSIPRTSRSTSCARAAPAASRSTPPTRRCASTTSRAASSSTASRKSRSTRTRRWR